MSPTIFFSHSQKKPKAKSTRMRSRQRPLQSCGVSILAIADIALGKTQEINGPLGSTLRKMAKLAKFVTPLIYAMQYIWLAILAFIDDRILFTEKLTEKLFPPSTYAFDKIDDVILLIVSLPEKFDVAVNKFPAVIHQIPILEWSLNLVILRLNSLASTLNYWLEENSREVNEKTIGVDKNCNSNNNEELEKSESTESFPPIPEAENKGVVHEVMAISSPIKVSYKEVLLEKGKEENQKMEKEWESEKEIDVCEEENDEKCCESVMISRGGSMKDDDPILQLFETAWLKKPAHY